MCFLLSWAKLLNSAGGVGELARSLERSGLLATATDCVTLSSFFAGFLFLIASRS